MRRSEKNSQSRRALASILLVVALFASAVVGCSRVPPDATPTPSAVLPAPPSPATVRHPVDGLPVLDGTKPIDSEQLADLAYERAILGARWLTTVLRSDGSFYYEYDPATDEYDEEDYNEVRHAGTTYSLFYAARASGDPELRQAAEHAVTYIDANSVPMEPGRALIRDGKVKLGGQALAIVALLEGRRVTGDGRHDALIHDLANFMLSLEVPGEPGRFYNNVTDGQKNLEPISRYYPGEALLALTRLAHHFPEMSYLDTAKRAAHWLVKVRDGDLTQASEPHEIDHWLSMGLNDLYTLDPQPDYVTAVALHAEAIVDRRWRAEDGFPARIGGARTSNIGYTSTATHGEAIVAAWALADKADQPERVARWSETAQRIAQFLMRVQYAGDRVDLFPRPARATGGWPGSVTDRDIRIDYVQHNLSALLGVWYLVRKDGLPQP